MFEVDAVITWVDGSDPAHRQKRDRYVAQAQAPLHENGVNPHRWVCSDELNFCIRSIANHAPWVRRIWIVTDDQHPVLPSMPDAFAAKISVVNHRAIFVGHEAVLPTFNSLSIETMLWRIPELSEHFLYFNDDVFLTAPVTAADFFAKNGPVLRGKWVDHSALAKSSISRHEARLLNHFNQINAASMIGYTPDHMFESAHVVHPMQRSVMAELFDIHMQEFVRNAAFRFRCTEQFLPQSLHNHACLASGNATILDTRDYLHIAVGALNQWSVDDIHAYLRRAARHQIKFICVNDLPEVERSFPDARACIEAAIGG